jgi:hypothetical protein
LRVRQWLPANLPWDRLCNHPFRLSGALRSGNAGWRGDALCQIQQIIEQCRYGIHDISRTESDGSPPLPRFNMPLELGVFLGAKRYGDTSQRRKRALILDREQYRYQRLISDIAGQDIVSHNGDPANAIAAVTTWLRQQSRVTTIPGGQAVAAEYDQFHRDLPAILAARMLDVSEMTFGDFSAIAAAWITEG